MSKSTYHGRRILKIQNKATKKITHRLSGQWVGHNYGDQFGTERQRKNFYDSNTETLLGVSEKVFWKGISEEDLKDSKFTDSLSFIL